MRDLLSSEVESSLASSRCSLAPSLPVSFVDVPITGRALSVRRQGYRVFRSIGRVDDWDGHGRMVITGSNLANRSGPF